MPTANGGRTRFWHVGPFRFVYQNFTWGFHWFGLNIEIGRLNPSYVEMSIGRHVFFVSFNPKGASNEQHDR